MRIHRKVSAVLFLVLAVFSAISYWALDAQIAPIFSDLQADLARTNLLRAERALTAEFDALKGISGDWAPWDDNYAFIQGRKPEFVAANLNGETIANLGLNLMLYLRPDSSIAWGAIRQPGQYDLQPVTQEWLTGWPLLRLTSHTSRRSELSGFVGTPEGPMMVSTRPIVDSDYVSPPAGTLVVGRFMDTARTATLRRQIEVDMGFLAPDDLAPDIEQHIQGAADTDETVLHRKADNALLAYRVLPDLKGDPALVMVVATPMHITTLGASMLTATAATLAGATLLVGALLWLILRQLVVRPLVSLADHMLRIRASGDLSLRLSTSRADEIGQLATRFDELLEESETARTQMLDQSYKAGVSESARGVLHNIRNTMTPLVFRADSARKALNDRNTSHIDTVIAELNADDVTAERRTKLLEYLRLSLAQASTLRDSVNSDLESIAEQARQIEEILSDQERIAHERPVLENVALIEAVVQAAAIVPTQPDIGIELDPSVQAHRVQVHRSGLLQILGNLFLNAYEAIRQAGRGGQIRVRAERDGDQDTLIRLSICDDGVGMERAELEQVFIRGYTSKEKGRGGLGLHWCANTLASMGGSIRARSDGAGKGAEFELLLPGTPG